MPLNIYSQTILENFNITWFASHQYLREYTSLDYPGFLPRHSQSSILRGKMINRKAVLFVCTCLFSLPLYMFVLFWNWSPFCFLVKYKPSSIQNALLNFRPTLGATPTSHQIQHVIFFFSLSNYEQVILVYVKTLYWRKWYCYGVMKTNQLIFWYLTFPQLRGFAAIILYDFRVWIKVNFHLKKKVWKTSGLKHRLLFIVLNHLFWILR